MITDVIYLSSHRSKKVVLATINGETINVLGIQKAEFQIVRHSINHKVAIANIIDDYLTGPGHYTEI